MAAELKLILSNKYERTILEECAFTTPLKIGTPKSQTDRLLLVLMMASAGVLKNDSFEFDILCKSKASATMTGQSYTKLFDMPDGSASWNMHIKVEDQGSFFYQPCAVIPFGGSSFDASLKVDLGEQAEFAMCDIFAVGRVGMGEAFQFRHYASRIEVRVGRKMALLDQTFYEKEDNEAGSLEKMIFFDGYSHQGMFYYYGPKEKEDQLFEIFEKLSLETGTDVWKSISRAKMGVCIRLLAKSAQAIEDTVQTLARKMGLNAS